MAALSRARRRSEPARAAKTPTRAAAGTARAAIQTARAAADSSPRAATRVSRVAAPPRDAERPHGVRSGTHLEPIGETWYYRRVVPPDVRAAFEWNGRKGWSKVKFSLGTKSQTEARRLEKIHDVEFEEKLAAARNTAPDGYPKHPGLRTAEQVSQVIYSEDRSPGWLDRALDDVPEADREEVRAAAETLQEQVEDDEFGIDRFWVDDLRDVVLEIYYDLVENNYEDGIWPKTRNELVELLRNYRSHMADPTIDWALQKWRVARNRPPQTEEDGERYIESFKRSAKVRLLAAVRRRHLTDWRDELKQDAALSATSINHRLEIVSAILRTGWRDAEISDPPDLSRINLQGSVTTDRGAWTRDEILIALRALEPHSWAAWVFVVALTTGTRLGEPVAARREWYDPMGCIHVPAPFTKMKKPHVLPIITLIQEPLVEHIAKVPAGQFMFGAPRPSKPTLKLSHEASKWFSRFFGRKGVQIDRVFHELRHTWIEAARVSPIKKEVYEIISGHSARTISDRYGGAKPDELMAANEEVCKKFLDTEMTAAVHRLVT
jgi:integrase